MQIGDILGSYTLKELVGTGGMATVWRAQHNVLTDNEVAIKVLDGRFLHDPVSRERFLDEGQLQHRLAHPNILKVIDVIDQPNLAALIMELAHTDLSVHIEETSGPIPWHLARPLFLPLLDAVETAHNAGIIHRDLKPSNVLLVREGDQLIPKLTDFGIAKQAEKSKTRTGSAMGTLAYMAPEQHLNAKDVDVRADIYALGMTLYEMLTGRIAFDAEGSDYQLVKAKLESHPPPPSSFYPHIPEHVESAVLAALALKKEQRLQNCSSFRTILLDGAGVHRDPADPSLQEPGPQRRRIDIVMPQLGESIAEGTISKWLKAVGDDIAEDEPLLEVSTDKVDAEIPSVAAGRLVEILHTEGETVEIQTVIARMETDAAAVLGSNQPTTHTNSEELARGFMRDLSVLGVWDIEGGRDNPAYRLKARLQERPRSSRLLIKMRVSGNHCSFRLRSVASVGGDEVLSKVSEGRPGHWAAPFYGRGVNSDGWYYTPFFRFSNAAERDQWVQLIQEEWAQKAIPCERNNASDSLPTVAGHKAKRQRRKRRQSADEHAVASPSNDGCLDGCFENVFAIFQILVAIWAVSRLVQNC